MSEIDYKQSLQVQPIDTANMPMIKMPCGHSLTSRHITAALGEQAPVGAWFKTRLTIPCPAEGCGQTAYLSGTFYTPAKPEPAPTPEPIHTEGIFLGQDTFSQTGALTEIHAMGVFDASKEPEGTDENGEPW